MMTASSEQESNPRRSAAEILQRIAREHAFADQLVDRELKSDHLKGPDRGLLNELVFGVLRRQGTLDHIIGKLLDQPLSRLETRVLILLRLGLYQLGYLDRIPESAAVNETVQLAKSMAPRASGLVNAILRSYLRTKQQISFPDPLIDPAASIAVRHSHPEWLVRQWIDQLGIDETEALAAAASSPPPLTLRTNTLKIEQKGLLDLFSGNAIAATPCPYSSHGIILEKRHPITSLPGFSEGLFIVQDEASQIAGFLLEPQPGERILDGCAAPGGKATHLAQLMGNHGELLALDISPKKLRLIEETSARLSIGIISTGAANLRLADTLPHTSFDRILLDAPCSGLGIIRRNPEAKWRLTPQDIERLSLTQRILLENVWHVLKPGGTLVYSTCSTSLQENEEVVLDFVSRHTDCVLENLHQLLPEWSDLFTPSGMFRAWPHHHGMDGFFAARLRRI